MSEQRPATAGAVRHGPARPRRGGTPRARRASATLLVAAGLFAALLPFAGHHAAHAAHPLQLACDDIRALADEVADTVRLGVVVMDLQTGDRCELDSDRPVRMASLYKVVVSAEMFRQVAEGQLTLETPLTVEPRHHVDDPVGQRPSDPYTLTVFDAAQRAITFSDNGGATALEELLGFAEVEAATEWLGMPSTTFRGQYMSTPQDQATLYSRIYHGQVVDQAASQALLDFLLAQEIVDGIPRGLPEDVQAAHKTGTLATFLHDAGIVYAPGGAFVLVVMTEHNDYERALATIQQVTAAAYAPFSAADQPLLTADEAFFAESRPGSLPLAPGVGDADALVTASGGAADPNVDGVDGATAAEGAPGSEGSEGSGGSEDIPTLVVGAAERSTSRLQQAVDDLTRDPVLLAGAAALVLVVLALPVLALRPALARVRRRPAVRYRTSAPDRVVALPQQSARLRADRSERGLVMRFGSRRDDGGRSASSAPASRSVAEVAQQPVLPSKRLQRVAEHFRSQGELLASMRDQFEEEMEPLHELIVKQAQTMQALLQNLEERLRPLNEYADGEEANLTALEERIQAGGQDHVARSFAQYLDEQRRRIHETREQIDQQRVPFLDYGDAQRSTVETALSRFDNDIQALEDNLAEQRRVMVRMLDAMRSETFGAVKDYLDARQQALTSLADSGSTDPGEIGRAVAALRQGMEELAAKSDYVRALLQQTDAADRSLVDAAPAPRPLREAAPVAEDLALDEAEEEATA